MPDMLPFRPAIDHTPRRRSVIDLHDAAGQSIPDALGSATARAVLRTLGESPSTASGIAGALDSSLQNVQYHLEKLVDAGLVSEVGTWYSSKGREMQVYDLASERIELRLAPTNGCST